jgi:tetratricopeptide (TPR) repeat protein
LSDAIRLGPPYGGYSYTNRGDAYASLEQWDEALADYTKSIALNPDKTRAWYFKALVLLHLGDEERYRHICKTMVGKEFPQWTPWTCALAPASVIDYAVPIALAQKGASKNMQKPIPVQDLGAILFRGGRINEAIVHLTRAEQMLSEQISKRPTKVRTSPAYNWFLLSMAHHQAGHVGEAGTYLSKAIDRAETELGDETNPPNWNRRLTLQLFRKEAEALIKTPTANTHTVNTYKPAIAPKPK